MDNKIVLELIKKDLFELQMMVDMLHKADRVELMVVELTIRKTESMLNELRMLNAPETFAAAIPVQAQPEMQVKDEVQPVSEELIELEMLVEEPVVVVEQPVEKFEEPVVVMAEPVSQPEPEIAVLDEQPVVAEIVQTEAIPVITPEVMPEPAPEIQPEEVILPEPEPVVAVFEEPKQEAEPIDVHHKHKAHAHTKAATDKKVLGEQFSKETSLNERLGANTSQEPNIKPQPIANMKAAIGLNDKFLFTRILFNNDSVLFSETLDRIEQAATLREAVDYLNARFEWEKNDTSLKFIDLLKRRFQN